MEKESSNKIRVSTCVIITLVIFSAFIVRLFDWQIINGEHYREIANSSVSYTVTSDATRGEIYDANGTPLAVNKTGYKVVIDKLYLKGASVNDIIVKLLSLMETRQEKWIDNLPILYSNKNGYTFDDDAKTELEQLRNSDMLNLSANAKPTDYINKLAERYDAAKIADKKTQRDVISVRYNMERVGFSNTTPYTFADDISEDMVSIISEYSQNMSGVDVQTTTIRTNENPTVAPHIVGALGYISAEEYNEKLKQGKTYGYNDKIGKFGIEYAYEDILKGTQGTKIIQKNSDGTVVKVVETKDAQPGNTIFLTINSKYQEAANKALAENITAAKKAGEAAVSAAKSSGAKQQSGFGEDCEAGAAVMLRVSDFAVLASASYPNYDLEKYSKYGDYYVDLSTDKTSPLYNRALVGSFAPGSIFKPCVAMAALEEGVIDENTVIDCTKYYDYYPSDVVACMGWHGNTSLNSAITQSCNYFFAEVGRRLGIDTMFLYAEKFGLGVKTGVEVSESTGILAGRDSTNWYEGNTVQAAIGQSDNAFTPVQLATYVATIANNGTRYRTHLVDKIVNYSKDKVIKDNKESSPEFVEKVSVSDHNIKLVQNAMRSVVTSGYGTANYMLGSYPVSIAAKTGTAENSGSDHTTFICYAPFEKPEVAIAVVLEHGASGKYSMSVAKAMLDSYFSSKTSDKKAS